MSGGSVTGVVAPPTTSAKLKGVSVNQNRMACKIRGFRGNNRIPAPVGFPIKTAWQIHLGVSTRSVLSGQSLQQSREGVTTVILFFLHPSLSIVDHCKDRKPCGKWLWLYAFLHCGSI